MTDDLVKRLRDFDPHLHEWEVVDEAADRIEALTAERNQAWKMVAEADARLGQALGDALKDKADNARLRAALQVYADPCDEFGSSDCGFEGNMCCRTARAALAVLPHVNKTPKSEHENGNMLTPEPWNPATSPSMTDLMVDPDLMREDRDARSELDREYGE